MEILSKSQHGRAQHPNHSSCSLLKVKCVTTYQKKWSAALLQRCPGLQTVRSSRKGTVLFTRKNHITIIKNYHSREDHDSYHNRIICQTNRKPNMLQYQLHVICFYLLFSDVFNLFWEDAISNMLRQISWFLQCFQVADEHLEKHVSPRLKSNTPSTNATHQLDR